MKPEIHHPVRHFCIKYGIVFIEQKLNKYIAKIDLLHELIFQNSKVFQNLAISAKKTGN